MQAWDYIDKRHVEVGARRWLVTWTVRRHEETPACEGHDITECFSGEERAFPNRGLAVAWARKAPCVFDEPQVLEQVFAIEHGHFGTWDTLTSPIDALAWETRPT